MPCKRSSQVSYTPVFVVYYNKISVALSRIRRARIGTLARAYTSARTTVFKTELPEKQMTFSTAPFPSVLRIRRSPHEEFGGRCKMPDTPERYVFSLFSKSSRHSLSSFGKCFPNLG